MNIRKNVTREELIKFDERLKDIVEAMRTASYLKNRNHCVKCHFSLGER